jgi:flagellar basal body-associated protein FliL
MSEPTKDKKDKKEKKKTSKKKLLAIPLVLLLVAGVGYKMFLAPKPKPPEPKIAGALVPLVTQVLFTDLAVQ